MSLSLASLGHAASPQRFIIENPNIIQRGETLFFSASLSVEEESALHDLLKDGAVLELTIKTTLDRRRSWWTNAEVAAHTYTSNLRHDQLTRNFLITQPCEGALGELTRDRNLTRLLYGNWRRLMLPVGDMPAIRKAGPDREYILTVSFQLRHTEVPPWLEKSSPFWFSDVVPEADVTLTYHPDGGSEGNDAP
ncbi:MAG: DUF4390 domain-containing protein [Deltaproteobacteria bacterium]|nr:DUF4390 domain-containing protein [Deltaproteobacteria bacterium]